MGILKKYGWAIAGALVVCASYRWIKRIVLRPPGPIGLPLVGVVPQILRRVDTQHILLCRDWVQAHGDYYTMDIPFGTVHLFANPDDINVLYKDNESFPQRDDSSPFKVFMKYGMLSLETDDTWKRHRMTFSQLFTDTFLTAYYKSMVMVTKERMAQWKADGGFIKDLSSEMNTLALDVLGHCILGIKIEGFLTKQDVRKMGLYLNVLQFIPDSLRYFRIWPGAKPAFEIQKRVEDVCQVLIERAKVGDLDPTCFLSIAVKATDSKGKPWTAEEVIGEVETFVLAGFETTSNTLTFIFHLLSVNPHIQKRAREVIRQHYTGSYEELKELDYIWAIFREALRIYPTVAMNSRYCMKKTKIGSVVINPGERCLMLHMAHNMDEKIFEKPNEFLPERWLDAKTGKRKEGDAYHNVRNFGGGRRACIGMRFAEEEVMTILSMVLDTFELSPGSAEVAVPFLPTTQAVTISPTVTVPIRLTALVKE